MKDQFDREINYLRISVTERCNFRCQYCMPETPFSWVPKENVLTFEELFEFVKVCIDRGVNKIRVTGGEPTLREDLPTFIKMINDYKSGIDLAMTSNGYLLDKFAKPLKDAGLKRINISLDTLQEKKAQQISQKNILPKVLKGIEACLQVGLVVKLNTVLLKGVNDNEIIDLIDFAREKKCSIRFIEYMENHFAKDKLKGLSANEILEHISQTHTFKDLGLETQSPAHYYELEDGHRFGIIEPHKEDFCAHCNKIRLTAEGVIVPCLYFDEGKSIKEAIRGGDIGGAVKILQEGLDTKPEKNRWSVSEGAKTSERAFYVTGG